MERSHSDTQRTCKLHTELLCYSARLFVVPNIPALQPDLPAGVCFWSIGWDWIRVCGYLMHKYILDEKIFCVLLRNWTRTADWLCCCAYATLSPFVYLWKIVFDFPETESVIRLLPTPRLILYLPVHPRHLLYSSVSLHRFCYSSLLLSLFRSSICESQIQILSSTHSPVIRGVALLCTSHSQSTLSTSLCIQHLFSDNKHFKTYLWCWAFLPWSVSFSFWVQKLLMQNYKCRNCLPPVLLWTTVEMGR